MDSENGVTTYPITMYTLNQTTNEIKRNTNKYIQLKKKTNRSYSVIDSFFLYIRRKVMYIHMYLCR